MALMVLLIGGFWMRKYPGMPKSSLNLIPFAHHRGIAGAANIFHRIIEKRRSGGSLCMILGSTSPILLSRLSTFRLDEPEKSLWGRSLQFPHMLCALTFPDPIIRREAIHALGTIEYNNYISTATYPTVRFLLELIQRPPTPDRAAILNVLLSVARADYSRIGNIPPGIL